MTSARSRPRPRSRRLRPSKRRSSSGADGGTAGTPQAGAGRAGTSAALHGGAGSAGAAPPAGTAGAIRASSTGLSLDRRSIVPALPSRGRQPIALAPAPDRPRVARAAANAAADSSRGDRSRPDLPFSLREKVSRHRASRRTPVLRDGLSARRMRSAQSRASRETLPQPLSPKGVWKTPVSRRAMGEGP